jgi:hypothetical protein
MVALSLCISLSLFPVVLRVDSYQTLIMLLESIWAGELELRHVEARSPDLLESATIWDGDPTASRLFDSM